MEKRSGLVLFTGGLLLPQVLKTCWAHVADPAKVIECTMGREPSSYPEGAGSDHCTPSSYSLVRLGRHEAGVDRPLFHMVGADLPGKHQNRSFPEDYQVTETTPSL